MEQRKCFNPRTHTGCDFHNAVFLVQSVVFQSTHPHRVRHNWTFNHVFDFWFQSTHPHRVRLDLIIDARQRLQVSIHAPTQGATYNDFYRFSQWEFQSTHPHRVRHMRAVFQICLKSFNPRTHTGCDVAMNSNRLFNSCFNPRTHTGCDFLRLSSLRNQFCFNPRTHTGCDRPWYQ